MERQGKVFALDNTYFSEYGDTRKIYEEKNRVSFEGFKTYRDFHCISL